MAVEGMQIRHSFIAGGTIAAFTFVKMSAANTVVACAGATDRPIAVAQEAAASGGSVSACLLGVTKIEGDGDLAFGDQVGTSVAARAAAYTVTDTTKYIVGSVLIDNAAAGGYATIMFYGPGRTLA